MSWVHIQDVVGAMVFAIETALMNGVYNLVAPETARQKKIAQEIAKLHGSQLQLEDAEATAPAGQRGLLVSVYLHANAHES